MLFSRFIDNEADAGALLSLRHPINLRDSNVFQGNMGGAVTLFQTRMHASGQIQFENNTASNGGAIQILDQSIVCQAYHGTISLRKFG